MMQLVVEDGTARTLQEFADLAIRHLKANPCDEEVVQIADNITELAQDSMTRPDTLYPLPKGYCYRFSGFFGQVIGVAREEAVCH
jgi:hypothetical protein